MGWINRSEQSNFFSYTSLKTRYLYHLEFVNIVKIHLFLYQILVIKRTYTKTEQQEAICYQIQKKHANTMKAGVGISIPTNRKVPKKSYSLLLKNEHKRKQSNVGSLVTRFIGLIIQEGKFSYRSTQKLTLVSQQMRQLNLFHRLLS